MWEKLYAAMYTFFREINNTNKKLPLFTNLLTNTQMERYTQVTSKQGTTTNKLRCTYAHITVCSQRGYLDYFYQLVLGIQDVKFLLRV